MKYTLLKNFLPCGTFDGIEEEDVHGKYILFPPEVRGMIEASDFLKTPSESMIQILEEDSQVIDGIRYLKLYYN